MNNYNNGWGWSDLLILYIAVLVSLLYFIGPSH